MSNSASSQQGAGDAPGDGGAGDDSPRVSAVAGESKDGAGTAGYRTPGATNAGERRDGARPLTRGLGVVAGVATFGFVGLVDGLTALARAPRGAVAPHLAVLVVLHCVAVLVSPGIVLGAAEELLLESARRVPMFQRLAAWITGGPRRWFARDVDAATGVVCAAVGLATVLGPVFPAVYFTGMSFHNHVLAALAVLLVVAASVLVAALVIAALIAPLRWGMARLGRFASPGAVLSLGLAVASAQTARFVSLNWAVFHNLDFGLAGIALALGLGNVAALGGLGAVTRRRGRPFSARVLALCAVVPPCMFLISALTFGQKQTVASTIFNRSVATQYIARGLQVSVDLDRDGFSALFGGGDCNDRNAAIHPGAPDIPGNGIDENCSGSDAHVDLEETDGRPAYPLPPELANPRPCLVLLSVDAMRPDHLGVYGYTRPTSPNIDAWAQGAARFTNAYTASPRSLRSFAGIWTGRYASMVSWGTDVQFPPLSDDNVTLAEILRGGGYRTAAFVNADYFNNTVGFLQGFDEYHDQRGFKEEPGPTVAQVISFVRAHAVEPAPFFLWLHLMEPHDPYRDWDHPREFGHAPMDQYDEEIARADEALRPLLDTLRDVERRRPIVTVIIGDHGEAFGEHGVFHHSFDLHDEALRVPLIVRGPSIAPGPRNELASLLDLHPTLLNLAQRPDAVPVSGYSLVPALLDPQPRTMLVPGRRDHLYAEVTPDGIYPSEQKALYAPPWKIIYDLRRGTWELFDISRDRGETLNLYDDRADIAVPLRERLLSWADGASLTSNRSNEWIRQHVTRDEPRPQVPVRVRFGDVLELVGYDVVTPQARVGDFMRLTFYYRVLRRTRVPLWMGVYFEFADGRGGFPYNATHNPLYGRYPSTQWNAGEVIRDEVVMRLPADSPTGRLNIVATEEIDPTHERIPPVERARSDAALVLGTVDVVP